MVVAGNNPANGNGGDKRLRDNKSPPGEPIDKYLPPPGSLTKQPPPQPIALGGGPLVALDRPPSGLPAHARSSNPLLNVTPAQPRDDISVDSSSEDEDDEAGKEQHQQGNKKNDSWRELQPDVLNFSLPAGLATAAK